MREIGLVTLLSVAVTAAAPSPRDYRAAISVTPKSTEDFASCFARSQDRRGKAWSFVPRDHGGRFSNLGNRSGAATYFLVINDRGTRREVELNPVSPSGGQREAVSQCT
jgi:hypothetical protein